MFVLTCSVCSSESSACKSMMHRSSSSSSMVDVVIRSTVANPASICSRHRSWSSWRACTKGFHMLVSIPSERRRDFRPAALSEGPANAEARSTAQCVCAVAVEPQPFSHLQAGKRLACSGSPPRHPERVDQRPEPSLLGHARACVRLHVVWLETQSKGSVKRHHGGYRSDQVDSWSARPHAQDRGRCCGGIGRKQDGFSVRAPTQRHATGRYSIGVHQGDNCDGCVWGNPPSPTAFALWVVGTCVWGPDPRGSH